MKWAFLCSGLLLGIGSIWILLQAYRVIGRPLGQNLKHDAAMEYWSGAFKVMGFMGLITFGIDVIVFILDGW